MADVEVTVIVHGRDDVTAMIESALERRVRKQPGCCPRCRANEDPDKVPLHKHCHCTVYFVHAT